MKQLIVFDLDGTLAESKSAIDAEMAKLLEELLRVAQVAVISGGDFPQFETQLVAHLPQDDLLARLSLLPTCGTKFFQYDGGWQKRYSEDFTAAEKTTILGALDAAVDASGFKATQTWGAAIEDRGSQITYSALGQEAPLDAKKTWDPDFAKRKVIQATLATTLPDFSVTLGGSTSVDITKPGIDKAYGIHKLQEILGIPIAAMLCIGDAMFPGGNDYPMKTTGADAILVRDPQETKHLIQTVVACAA
jgi:phosphomannomutase